MRAHTGKIDDGEEINDCKDALVRAGMVVDGEDDQCSAAERVKLSLFVNSIQCFCLLKQ